MRKNKKNFLLENNINKYYFKNNLYLRDKVRTNKIIENIFLNLDDKKDAFHSLSKKFNFNFNKSKLKKFTKYKSIIIIGMGGSTLGVQAIYTFLKTKINKDLIFIDNLEQLKIEKIKKKQSLKNNLFIIISKSGNT